MEVMRAPLGSVPGGPKVMHPRMIRGLLDEVVEGINILGTVLLNCRVRLESLE